MMPVSWMRSMVVSGPPVQRGVRVWMVMVRGGFIVGMFVSVCFGKGNAIGSSYRKKVRCKEKMNVKAGWILLCVLCVLCVGVGGTVQVQDSKKSMVEMIEVGERAVCGLRWRVTCVYACVSG